MDWTVALDVVGRIALAGLLGILIGLERERDGHPAGTRTVAMVAMGAALFGAVSTTGFEGFVAERSSTNVQVDVTRVASQVVVGIGFLGAGIIFRQGGSVQNLTTAATLWAVAAVGLAAGVGEAGTAVAAGALVLVLLVVVPLPQRWILERWTHATRTLEVGVRAETSPGRLRALVDAHEQVDVRSWQVEKHDGRCVVSAKVRAASERPLDDLADSLVARDEVVELRVRG